MNKPRRKELERALAMIAEARAIIENCADEEQEAFDNMPEGLQESERGEKMEEAISAMVDAYETLEEVESNIEEVVET